MRKTQPPTMEEMDTALHLTLDRAAAAEAELARVQAKLDALMMAFNKNGSLGMLQLIAHDSNLPVEIRLRALSILLPYERPKFGTVDGLVIQGVSKERVHDARMRSSRRIGPDGRLKTRPRPSRGRSWAQTMPARLSARKIPRPDLAPLHLNCSQNDGWQRWARGEFSQ